MGGPAGFDVVVVGARCSGAPLAQRLAGAGVSVALLDAAPMPGPPPLSTHLIQPPGMDELDALGVGHAVRGLSPALHAFRLAYDGREARLPYGEGRAGHCLRRPAFDQLLQDAAVQAGAELRPESRVVGLVRARDGRVGGVEVRHRRRGTERLHAHLVVGADGRNSTVAKLVGAEEYLGYDGPRAVYWAYWRRPPGWDPHELHNFFDGDDARVVFPTDGDLLLIASVPPVSRARGWRGDHAGAYVESIQSHEPIGSFLGGREPVSEVRGMLRPRYFFRASAGPGWALIGDAGHHKEFVVGLGITDALRDARAVAEAVLEGDPAALQAWWRRRDLERIEMFQWSRELGAAEPVDALKRLLPALLAAPGLEGSFGEVIDGRRSPYDLIPPARVVRGAVGALLRGEAGVLPPLLRSAGRRVRARTELRRRKRALQRVGAGGFEPPTSATQRRRATRLRYAPLGASLGGHAAPRPGKGRGAAEP